MAFLQDNSDGIASDDHIIKEFFSLYSQFANKLRFVLCLFYSFVTDFRRSENCIVLRFKAAVCPSLAILIRITCAALGKG